MLLAMGALAVLLLGAFVPRDSDSPARAVAAAVEPEPQAAQEETSPEVVSTPKNHLPPAFSEIVKMAQNHVPDATIVAYIRNSGHTYSPTADDLIYLMDIGISQTVLAALSQPEAAVASVETVTPVPESEPATAAAAAPLPATNAFYNSLVPYGTWFETPDNGLAWQPTAETVNPDWRPYVDDGQWAYNDNGWTWQSGYSWGSIAFHYGRWTRHSSLGWLWVPGTTWGPAWVSWRVTPEYSGWAPLPPGVSLSEGSGLTFQGQRVANDFDFGIPPGWFAFVSADGLLNSGLIHLIVPTGAVGGIYNRSYIVNNYCIVNHKIVNRGPGPSSLATVSPGVPVPAAISSQPAPRRPLAEAQELVNASVPALPPFQAEPPRHRFAAETETSHSSRGFSRETTFDAGHEFARLALSRAHEDVTERGISSQPRLREERMLERTGDFAPRLAERPGAYETRMVERPGGYESRAERGPAPTPLPSERAAAPESRHDSGESQHASASASNAASSSHSGK